MTDLGRVKIRPDIGWTWKNNSHTPTRVACPLSLKVTQFYMAKGG